MVDLLIDTYTNFWATIVFPAIVVFMGIDVGYVIIKNFITKGRGH
jgi:hypothetical protein